MKLQKMGVWVAVLLFVSQCVCAAEAPGKRVIAVPLSFDDYYSYDQVVEALKALHQTFPHLTKLDVAGTSEEGRAIYCMTVNNPKTGAELSKPGVYADGNIHGNEIQAGEVALYLLNYLLTNYGKNDEITALVDKKCFYVVPVVNVDGRYHFFADPNTPSSNRSLRIPKDDDHDGLIDEDGPDDLDGDGNICQMRKRDPFGKWKTDPEDPRLMIPCKPGEKGEWTLLGDEGIDNDGDGLINEDAEGYVDGNRNWGYDWMPSYVQSGAGDYPFEGKGIKALAEFIRQRPNICVAWAFHNNGGMYLRGPSTEAQGEYHPADIAVYDYLGKNGEKITPGYRYLISWKDLYATYGDFCEWMMMVNGVYAFTGELFQNETETFHTEKDKPKDKKISGGDEEEGLSMFRSDPSEVRERLQFNDHLVQGDLYKPWKPFKHPQFGDIEIGGWVKMSSRLPAPFMLKELVHRNASAVIFSAKQTPELNMDVFETKKIGANLTRVRVRLANSKAIPTISSHAQQVKLYPKDILRVSGSGITVNAAGPIQDIYTDKVAYKEHRPEVQFLAVPGFGKVEYQFLISGSGRATIEYTSLHGGKIVKTVELK